MSRSLVKIGFEILLTFAGKMTEVVLRDFAWVIKWKCIDHQPSSPKFYLRNHPYPHLHACKYILAVNIYLAPLLYMGLTCNLDSLWLATYFSGLKECQGIQDVVLMYCQWFSIQHAVILSPLPPMFYLRNHPHPPPCGRQDYSWCQHTSRTRAL